MNISVLSVFKQIYDSFLQTSLVNRSQDQNLVTIDVQSFSSFVPPKVRIDAPTFGPGAGMVIKPEIVKKAVDHQEKRFGKAYKLFFSPQGKKLTQKTLQEIYHNAQKANHLMLLAARYEGMDARVEEEYADMVISVGDFVLMGGDLPAMMLIEALLRLIPGVIGRQESVQRDSFTGPFVDYPCYTEPVDWHGKIVPEIIRSGNHQAIEKWRKNQAAKKSVQDHFTWVRSQILTQQDRELSASFIPNHYVVLMHSDVIVGHEYAKGVTSVTSIDIHDIARSSSTYGIEHFFIVTPLKDQQHIAQTLLDFWQKGSGITYNPNRHLALEHVSLESSFDDVIKQIEKKEGKKPIVIVTSAREYDAKKTISYWDQAVVWKEDRPILLVFGTGQGLTSERIEESDFILLPIYGFSEFNHLSVRSAVGIVLDRWLGINPRLD